MVSHERTKHVYVKYHFISQQVKKSHFIWKLVSAVKLEKVSTQGNLVDMATNVVLLTKFEHWVNLIQLEKWVVACEDGQSVTAGRLEFDLETRWGVVIQD